MNNIEKKIKELKKEIEFIEEINSQLKEDSLILKLSLEFIKERNIIKYYSYEASISVIKDKIKLNLIKIENLKNEIIKNEEEFYNEFYEEFLNDINKKY